MSKDHAQRVSELFEQLRRLPSSAWEQALAARHDIDPRLRADALARLRSDADATAPSAGAGRRAEVASPRAEAARPRAEAANPRDDDTHPQSDDTSQRVIEWNDDDRDAIPERIGPYRVISEIGRGGMGRVLLAVRDDEQIRRKVAIKLLKRGLDTDEMLRRFELERQVLNALNHPNIARCVDAGAMPDGRPYIVMEYVEGLPLLEYCEKQRLAMDERLEVFTQICDAVHHAHQNLVVHRDLKPANILVDSKGQPKLLDFGIAKLVNPSMLSVTLATEPGLHIMTPEYASPEQVRGEAVTTSSDIYSLGVILYELLTGNRPYRLKTRLLDEIRRAICDDEPQRPSAAATTIFPVSGKTAGGAAHASSAVAAREAELRRLRRSFRGELDNIVLKALRKVPRHRYESAAALGEDLDAFLHGLPVKAQPDSWGYRASKFFRRNRALTLGVVASMLALGVGLLGTYWQLAEKRAALQRAVVAEQSAIAAAKRLDGMLDNLLKQVRTSLPRIQGSSAAMVAIAGTLKEVADELEKAATDPITRCRVAETLSTASGILGGVRGGGGDDQPQALALADRAIRLLEAVDQKAARSPRETVALAKARLRRHDTLKQRDPSGAQKELELAEASLELALKSSNADENLCRALAQVLKSRADLLFASDPDTAAKLLDRAADYRRRSAESADDDVETELSEARLRNVAGRIAEGQGQLADAERHYRASVDAREALFNRGKDRQSARDYAMGLESLGRVRRKLGNANAAMEHLSLAMRLLEERAETESLAAGRDVVDLIRVGAEHALALAAAGQPDAARTAAETAFRRGESAVGADDSASGSPSVELLAAFGAACDAVTEPGIPTSPELRLTAAKAAVQTYRRLTRKAPAEQYWADQLLLAERRREQIEASDVPTSRAGD